MKKIILFIGDMNGNAQALARRFVDLGYKCEVISFVEDYAASQHFEYRKTDPNITVHKQIIIYNGYPVLSYHNIYGFLFRIIVNTLYALRKKTIQSPKNHIQQIFSRSNLLIIGTGISPVLLSHFGRSVDIYYPSSLGVEFIGDVERDQASKGLVRHMMRKFTRVKMINSLKQASFVTSSDVGLTHKILDKLDLKNYHLDLIPFVEPLIRSQGSTIRNACAPNNLIMYSRLHWVRPDNFSDSTWSYLNKNNDLFLCGFAHFLERYRWDEPPHLTIVEYGKDVAATHSLVKQLGIQEHVSFHPIISKEEMLSFLDNYDILVGEFTSQNTTIGGTGLEALQLNKPFINGGGRPAEDGQNLQTPPPVYFCNTVQEISNILLMLIKEKVDPLKKDREQFLNQFRTNEIIKSWMKRLPNA